MRSFGFSLIFRQQLICDCNITLLTCVCVMYHVTCTTRCYCTIQVWNVLPDTLLFISKRQKVHRRHCVLRYGVLLSSSLHLICFFILVFNVKQKHEEGQRLLHYLQQTNTALAFCTFIYTVNQEVCGKEIKMPTILCFHWWYRIFNF
jgi:hypothetical protein